MRRTAKLAASGFFCLYLIASPAAHSAEGVSIVGSVSLGTCHVVNLFRDLINRYLNGPPASHKALSSLPQDFFRIAAWNRSFAASLDTAFIPPGTDDPGNDAALRVARDNVEGIRGAVQKLRTDIEAVDSTWVNANAAVWTAAEKASFDKAIFANGELEVIGSSGSVKIDQAMAHRISKDLIDQADTMERMGNNIGAALASSNAPGASGPPLPTEACGPD